MPACRHWHYGTSRNIAGCKRPSVHSSQYSITTKSASNPTAEFLLANSAWLLHDSSRPIINTSIAVECVYFSPLHHHHAESNASLTIRKDSTDRM